MTALLLDLDGVLYEGERAIPGAADAVCWVQQQQIPHLFLTNTTSRPRSALVKKLAAMGITIDESHLLTPAVAACQWIQENVRSNTALFIPQATQQEFQELPLIDPFSPAAINSGGTLGAIVVGDLGVQWDFATLNQAFRLLMSPAKPYLIALGLTRYWRAEEGLRLDAGPYVRALQYASGVEPIVLGKPALPFFEAALHKLKTVGTDTIMVGDDIRGDIEGALQAGINAIMVRTGKYQPGDLQLGITPAACIDSIADLPQWWQTHIQSL